MREPKDFKQTAPGLRTFSLNSDYAHWLTLEDQEESMLPRLARPECLNDRVERLPLSPTPTTQRWRRHLGEAKPFVDLRTL